MTWSACHGSPGRAIPPHSQQRQAIVIPGITPEKAKTAAKQVERRGVQRHHAAQRIAHHRCLPHPDGVEHTGNVGSEVVDGEGEDLSQTDARIACVQVFALGGRTSDDEAADLGYYGLRITLGLHFERDILEYAAGAQGPHIPAFIDLTRAIAARFGVVISDKTAVQMVPIAGAVTGAMLNLIFIRHFQDVARGHFIVRRLERKYSVESIKQEYQSLLEEEVLAEEFSPVEGW